MKDSLMGCPVGVYDDNIHKFTQVYKTGEKVYGWVNKRGRKPQVFYVYLGDILIGWMPANDRYKPQNGNPIYMLYPVTGKEMIRFGGFAFGWR